MLAQTCPRCKSSRIQHGYEDSPLRLRLIGIYELLCNNCNLEFKGFALPGTLGRVQSNKEESSRNRRRTPRIKVQVPVSVSLIDIDPISSGLRFSPPVEGHTQVLSRAGAGLLLPTIRFGDRSLSSTDQKLRVKLHLPAGPVHMHVAVVQYEQLVKGKTETCWLIGTRITKMSENERTQLTEYLNTLTWLSSTQPG